MTVVVDASVWVAAADNTDRFSTVSRDFLRAVIAKPVSIVGPEIVHLEVACALARRTRDPAAARKLGNAVLALAEVHRTDRVLIAEAIMTGTEMLLRSADALCAAVAKRVSGTIVTWDEDLLQRAGAVTPATWVEKHS